jgi:hypothetical protein
LTIYIVTAPPYVLVEADAPVTNLAELQRWPLRGNTDQPGGQTLWSEYGPRSPEK